MTMKITFGATLAGLLLATAANAETAATAYTDLNVRSGPGTAYAVIAVIPKAQVVSVDGCLADANWCRVTYDTVNGWASGDYLTSMVEQPIYLNRERLAVPVVTYEDKGPGAALTGGAGGAIAGAVVGGPVGALIGAAIGASVLDAAVPDKRITTYVRANPIAPIYLDGEVVVGAGVPPSVPLTAVPDSAYDYAYINGVPVLVEREQRRVIYVVR